MRVGVVTIVLLIAGCAVSPSSENTVASEASQTSVNKSVSKGEVPFDLSSGRPVIQAEINGRSIAVEFDTGSQGAMIPKALADEWGLQVIGDVQLGSPYGKPVPAKLVSLGSVVVDGVVAADVRAVVEVDESFRGPNARIVIGPAQFRGQYVTLDYARLLLTIAADAPLVGATWQALKNGLPEGAIDVQGQSIPLHVDSGNPGAITLPIAVAEQLSPKPALREVGRARVVDKEFSIFLGTVNTDAVVAGIPVKLGDVTFADVPYANLGSQGLQNFSVVIDPANNRWQLISPNGQVPLLTSQPSVRRN
jgi:hypothetical protein